MVVLRMANEREMRVENEGEAAGHCATLEARQTTAQGGSASKAMFKSGAEGAFIFATSSGQRVHLQRTAKILEPVQPLFDHVEAGRVTESDRAIIAERSAGHDRDIGFAEQTVGEVLRS